jgi:hypothetical protein
MHRISVFIFCSCGCWLLRLTPKTVVNATCCLLSLAQQRCCGRNQRQHPYHVCRCRPGLQRKPYTMSNYYWRLNLWHVAMLPERQCTVAHCLLAQGLTAKRVWQPLQGSWSCRGLCVQARHCNLLHTTTCIIIIIIIIITINIPYQAICMASTPSDPCPNGAAERGSTAPLCLQLLPHPKLAPDTQTCC